MTPSVYREVAGWRMSPLWGRSSLGLVPSISHLGSNVDILGTDPDAWTACSKNRGGGGRWIAFAAEWIAAAQEDHPDSVSSLYCIYTDTMCNKKMSALPAFLFWVTQGSYTRLHPPCFFKVDGP